jgi:hypothetical protein
MDISNQEAAEALRSIEASRKRFRIAIGSRRGHQHLWLWGVIWTAMALLSQYDLPLALRSWGWVDLAGVAGSFAIGWRTQRQVRGRIDRRFLGAIAAVAVYGMVAWPLVLRGIASPESAFAYIALLVMQIYVLAGIWFDNGLLWTGLILSALILVGFLYFVAIFWIWIAIFGGGGLILSGFYIRQSWK